jgi:hypothetical protein
MDQGPEAAPHDPVVVTGAGHQIGAPCDPTPFLKARKTRKFMGVQDDLAVVAAGRALAAAGLAGSSLGERAGLYLAVGYIPFEQENMDLLLESSIEAGGFSMRRFARDAFSALNPLLTFRCLSNMPAFHVSMNFDLHGPSFVTYPGPGQLYLALEEAVAALTAGIVDVALVAGVAHQRNALVEHHFSRVVPPVEPADLRDAAACFVVERSSVARGRALSRLRALDVSYVPHHPFEESFVPRHQAAGADPPEGDLGPASLPALLSLNLGRAFDHRIESRDGIRASSSWEPA